MVCYINPWLNARCQIVISGFIIIVNPLLPQTTVTVSWLSGGCLIVESIIIIFLMTDVNFFVTLVSFQLMVVGGEKIESVLFHLYSQFTRLRLNAVALDSSCFSVTKVVRVNIRLLQYHIVCMDSVMFIVRNGKTTVRILLIPTNDRKIKPCSGSDKQRAASGMLYATHCNNVTLNALHSLFYIVP